MSLFKKKTSGFDEQEKQGAAKSSGSIIVLLILLAGFAYLYFFTSLIVPHETPTPANVPIVATEVKQSMPPKPTDQPAPAATAAASKPEEAKPAVSPVPPAAKPVSSPAPAPAITKPAAPAPATVTAKPDAPAPAPSTGKPAAALQPQAAAKAAATPPVTTAPKKAPVTEKKAEPKPGKAVGSKPVTAFQQKELAKTAKVSPPPAVKAATGEKTSAYSVFAGEFTAGAESATAEAKIARLGIKPVSRKETRSSHSMHRLFYGAYTDYDVYLAELDKLRQSTKGAFGVEKNGTYFLYAGSFSVKDRVEKEKKYLAAKGINLQIQQTVLSLSTVKLTAGPFSSKKEADNAAAKMKGAGLAAKVVAQRR